MFKSEGGNEMAFMDAYSGAWTNDHAAHLLRRTGFSASSSVVEQIKNLDITRAVNQIMDFPDSDDDFEIKLRKSLPAPDSLSRLQSWWLFRMAYSPYAAQEQLTLFLHDTIVSEYSKINTGISNRVKNGNDGSESGQSCHVDFGLAPDKLRKRRIASGLMQDQNQLLRKLGPGLYGELLKAVTRNPAMLIYLDNQVNKKGRAQENYAREIMELFSLGVGNYSEEDVRETARAFTGQTINKSCKYNWPYTYIYSSSRHDTKPKTVFNQTFNHSDGNQDTDYVIDLIMNHISNAVEISPFHDQLPAAAIYISWKILTWYVYENLLISHPAVFELAQYMYQENYHIRKTLKKLFNSEFFYNDAWKWAMIKHPADYIVTPIRTLGLTRVNLYTAAKSYLSGMGMSLLEPPNVAGWNHGKAWINSGYLLNRYNYANYLSTSAVATDTWTDKLLDNGIFASSTDHSAMIEWFTTELIGTALYDKQIQSLNAFLTQIEGSSGSAAARYRRKIRGLIHVMMALPQYQLK